MVNLVLDDTIIYKISNVSSTLKSVFKSLWTEDRKSFNKIKQYKDDVYKLREKTQYFSMSGNEMYVNRGLEFLENIQKYTALIIPSVPFDKVVILKENLEVIDSILTAIKLIDHKVSIWSKM